MPGYFFWIKKQTFKNIMILSSIEISGPAYPGNCCLHRIEIVNWYIINSFPFNLIITPFISVQLKPWITFNLYNNKNFKIENNISKRRIPNFFLKIKFKKGVDLPSSHPKKLCKPFSLQNWIKTPCFFYVTTLFNSLA